MSRPERVAQIRRLLATGLTSRQVAEELGLAITTVRNTLADPDGQKQRRRRERYRGTCEACGAKTEGSGGYKVRRRLCLACTRERQHEGRYWTPDTVVAAIRAFADEHGRPPVATEWLYGRHGKDVDGYPCAPLVLREFGSWANAIEAAGFPRPYVGHNYRGAKKGHAGPRIPTAVYLDDLARVAVDGVAPSTDTREGRRIHATLTKRGISWADACASVGIVQKRYARNGRVSA